jgi:tryptophan 2-monooxygenase
MAVLPNRTTGRLQLGDATSVTVTPQAYIDTPYMSYASWLQACDADASGLIGSFDNPSALSVAIVGAGPGGLAAAYELLKLGLNVTVYEASERIGGRCYSKQLYQDAYGNNYLAELGAMRFPPSEEALFYYINKLQAAGYGIQVTPTFPDPGKVLTGLSFQGQAQTWDNPNVAPAGFETVFNGWIALCEDGFTSADGSITLLAPATLTNMLQPQSASYDPIGAITAWNAYIAAFKNLNFYQGLLRIFTDANAPGGTPWSFPEDFEKFGALGIGSGGFGPLYNVDFLDIIRLPINGLETDQAFVPTGISSFTDALATLPFTPAGGSDITTVGSNVLVNTAVTAITPNGDGTVALSLYDTQNAIALGSVTYDRVIVATTHRSMEISMGLGAGNTETPPALSTQAADALRSLACMNSSKTFVLTPTQYWNDDPTIPVDIASDTLVRGMYSLDYNNIAGANPNPPGVVLLSYVWADDSIKQMAYSAPISDQPIVQPVPQLMEFNLASRCELLSNDITTIMNAAGISDFSENDLSPMGGSYSGSAISVDWQSEPYYFGAFKLNDPGQDYQVQILYYDFLKATGAYTSNPDTGVYIAGDSISYTGGWIDGALQTALNAASAVVVSLGGSLNCSSQSPIECLSPSLYTYETPYPFSPILQEAAE